MGDARFAHWRQFSCITITETPYLDEIVQLSHCDKNAVFVLLTHSCSIVADLEKEPKVEYVIGRLIDKPDPSFMHRKNPRILHIELLKEKQPVWVELLIPERGTFNKEELLKCAPSKVFSVPPGAQETFKRWLGDRYTRPAFPDAFNERMRKANNKIEQAMKLPAASSITGIYISLDPSDEELNNDTPYELGVYMTYDPQLDDDTFSACGSLRDKIQDALGRLPENEISLIDEVKLVSEDDMSLTELRRLSRYSFDYLSEREIPGGDHPIVD